MSEFQERVLELVSTIPRGKVITYKEIARALGKPRASRAVGSVLARNPHPIVPCHRVVRSDGSIGGYKLGGERKAELLSGEGVAIKSEKVELEKFLIAPRKKF